MSGEPVIYANGPACRTDEAGSMSCRNRPKWEIRSADDMPYRRDGSQIDWVDYVCSNHLISLLTPFTQPGPVLVDRYPRQGRRL